MPFKFLCLSLLLICSGCNSTFFSFKAPDVLPVPFSFASLTNLEDLTFDAGSSTVISSVVTDQNNNVYVIGSFTGGIDGVAAQGSDIFLLKLNSAGTLLWKIHFNSSVAGIADTSLSESVSSMIWDTASNSIYAIGSTTSPLKEPNPTATEDIIVMKINANGNINWLKHYGETTQNALRVSLGNPAIDFSSRDTQGTIKMSPAGKLIMTFNTTGSLFEVSAGLDDIGVMKIEPANGSIIAGRQIGSVTLAAWGVAQGIAVDGSLTDTLSSANFAFDGSLIVIPYRTSGDMVETNTTVTNDAGYLVLNADLTVNSINQLGVETYSAWVAAGNYSGSTNADNQFRGVVVNGPGDYLFFGKTSNNMSEVRLGVDFFFARYINNDLTSLTQYGATTMPTATASEEPRFMETDANGNIYCVGHTRSSLFEGLMDLLNPVVFRVDEDGVFQAGVQLGITTSAALGLTTHHTLIQGSNFAMKDGKILMGVNNDPLTAGVTFDGTLWAIDAP